MNESTISDIEGWFVQDIELNCKIAMSGAYDSDVKIERGYMFYPSRDWGLVVSTTRTGEYKIMDWKREYSGVTIDGYKYNRSNGVYQVTWYEYDDDDDDKKLKLAKKVVTMVGSYFGVNPSMSESVIQIGELAFDIDQNDEVLGTYEITWWSPQACGQNPRSGFYVEHSYK